MKISLAALLPLLLVGFAAGGLRALAVRAQDAKARKLLTFGWIALLLAGPPLWLFLAATLRLL